eukprot:9292909-Karenia_brevis.AAC.1
MGTEIGVGANAQKMHLKWTSAWEASMYGFHQGNDASRWGRKWELAEDRRKCTYGGRGGGRRR